MTPLSRKLAKSGWECIHFIPNQLLSTEDLIEKSIFISEISGKKITSKDDLLDALRHAFQFPNYFGNNWDALEECLVDLTWLPARGFVLAIRNSREFWRTNYEDAGMFVEIWLSSAEKWAKRSIPFHLVFMS